MASKADLSCYGCKAAEIQQLVELINNGDEESKRELQTKLHVEPENLQRRYHLVYSAESAAHALLVVPSRFDVTKFPTTTSSCRNRNFKRRPLFVGLHANASTMRFDY